jgi:hypothetical protein
MTNAEHRYRATITDEGVAVEIWVARPRSNVLEYQSEVIPHSDILALAIHRIESKKSSDASSPTD